MTDSDSNLGKGAPEPVSVATQGALNPWISHLMNQWPHADGILGWVLYMLGYAFLISDDQDSFREIVKILTPLDKNLAALLSSKLDRPR